MKNLNHYGIKQRWIVIYSDKARERSQKTLKKAEEKELEKIKKKI